MKAYKYIKSKKAIGNPPRCGPDKYVCVQVCPDDVEPLKKISSTRAAKLGIDIIYCGDGYSNRQKSPLSMLNKAKTKAQKIVDYINSGGNYNGPKSISRIFS